MPGDQLAVQRPVGYDRRWWVLAVLCLSPLVIGIDSTILNVALPGLRPCRPSAYGFCEHQTTYSDTLCSQNSHSKRKG